MADNPDKKNSPAIPGNSRQRKKELTRLKSMLATLGIESEKAIAESEHAPDTHTRIGNSISSMGVAVAIILYLFNRAEVTTLLAIVLLFGSLVYPALTVLNHWKIKSKSTIVAAILANAVLCFTIGWLSWPEAPLIVIKINSSSLPLSVAPHSVMRVMQLHPWITYSDGFDLLQIRNDAGDEGFWPSAEEFATKGPNSEPISLVEIANHSQQEINRGSITFRVKYDKGTAAGCGITDKAISAENIVLIPPLDPGKSFTFAAINESKMCAWLFMPTYAKLEISGGLRQKRSVPIKQDIGITGILGMSFLPTMIKWSGLPPSPRPHYLLIQTNAYHSRSSNDEGARKIRTKKLK